MDDTYGLNIKEQSQFTYTKRGMLSAAQSIYDPIGWFLPLIMELRMYIQGLWKEKLDWDDALDEKQKLKFQKCLVGLPLLKTIKIPRWTGGSENSVMELIGFCDASGDGFAAVIYSRIKTPSGIQITLIASRGNVTPLKTKVNMESGLCTIPKMELQAIVLRTELYTTVKKSFAEVQTSLTCVTVKWP